MKSLFIINDFPPILGGQSNYYFNLCHAFKSNELIILAPKCPGYASFDRTHHLKIIRKPYLFTWPIIEKLAKILLPIFYTLPILAQEKIDCLHCGHVLSTGIVGLFFNKCFKLPYIVYTHSADILEFQKYPPIKKLLKTILANAAKVACNSQFTYNHLLLLGLTHERIQLIYPKIDSAKFNTVLSCEGIIDLHNLRGKQIILSINRLIERKGNDMMINAMPEILKIIPNALYVIGGQGNYKKKLRVLVKALNLDQHVLFVNNLSDLDVIKWYQCADVFVMISRSINEEDTEGFGAVFLEANACGKPVIGGRSGGIPEAVEEGVSGLLVNPLDVKSISNAVIKILSDKAYATSLGKQGKQRVLDHFDSSLYVNDLEKLLDI